MPDSVDEDEDLDELPDMKVGYKVENVRDGVDKPRTLIRLLLDPSLAQLLRVVKCAEKEMLQIMEEFIELDLDE